MLTFRKGLYAVLLALGLLSSPAFIAAVHAQTPIPAEPDTERRTRYTATAQTGPFDVGFDIYGDGIDYQNWVKVFINGVELPQSGNWTLSSPSGSLSAIARPITNAQITFNAAQTGTVDIVGARRPRRTSQFTENRPITAHALNQVLTDLWMTERERWDQLPRALLSQPGTTLGPLPAPSACINGWLNLGGNGLTPTCLVGGVGSGNVVGPVSSLIGDLAAFTTTSGNAIGVATPTATNVYVATTGTDTGNCQNAGTPCATATYALNQATTSANAAGIYSTKGQSIVLNFGAGIFNQSVFVTGKLSGSFNTVPNPNGVLQPGQILIKGAGSTSTTIAGDPGFCAVIAASWNAVVGIESVKLTGTQNSCQSILFSQMGGIIHIYDDVNFGAATVEHIHIDDSTSQVQAWCPYTISGGAQDHIISVGQYLNSGFCAVGSKQNITLTGTTHTNTTVNGFSSTASLSAGMSITGSGIPVGTTIASVDSGTSITISQAATSSTTAAFNFLAPILLTGTPNFSDAFAVAEYGGHVQFNGAVAFSGSATGTRFRAANNGTLTTQGSNSATYLPGNAAGLEYGGGRWVENPNEIIAAPPGSGQITLLNDTQLLTSINNIQSIGVVNLNSGNAAVAELYSQSDAGIATFNAFSTAAGGLAQLKSNLPGGLYIDQNSASGNILMRTGATPTIALQIDPSQNVTLPVHPLGIASGGTNCASASGTCLDNITGFSSTGLMIRSGAGLYSFALTLPAAQEPAHTGDVANTAGSLNLALQTVFQAKAVMGTNFSTTSSTLVDVTGASVTFTPKAPTNVTVFVQSVLSITGAGQCLFALNIDGSDTAVLTSVQVAGPIPIPLVYDAGTLSAASHTIKLRARNSDGTSTCAMNFSSVANGIIKVVGLPP